MPGINFDIQGARAAGYSDSEIADAMGKAAGFNTAAARQAGYGDTDIITRLSQSPRAPAAPVNDNAGAEKLAANTGIGEAMLVGAGRTFDRIGKGMQQLYYTATGDDQALAKLKAQAENDDRVYQPLRQDRPVATTIGESAPSMAIPVGGTATTLGTIGKLAASAAATKAAEYGSAEDRLKNAAASGAAAAVGGAVIPKVAAVVGNAAKGALKGLAGNITPEAMALYNRAQELGIPVNVAQLGDSKFLKTLASSAEQMPFTGAAQKVVDQKDAFTRAVSNTFGEDTSKITPEVYAAAKQRIGQQFDTLAARNNLQVTSQVQTSLQKIVDDASATGSDDTIRAVNNIVSRVADQSKSGAPVIVNAAGQPVTQASSQLLPGAAYSSVDSELSNIIKAGGEKGMYAKRLQTELRSAMDDSISEADQQAWRSARDQYRNLKAVRNIVARDAADGSIPPTQLTNALNSTEAGKEVMAMGARGTLGDLSQIGRSFVRDQVPNSGTAQRALAMSMIGGGGLLTGMAPGAVGGMLVGGATAGRLVTKLLNDPRVIESINRQGLTAAQVAAMPPSTAMQIIGGVTGMTTLRNIGEQ